MKFYQNYAKRLPGSYTTKAPAASGKAMKLYQSYAKRLQSSRVPVASGRP